MSAKTIKSLKNIIKNSLLGLIRLYQKTLSPDQGVFKVYYPYGFCPYEPHCSEYAHQSIAKHGAVRGSLRAVWRVLRCHPWAKGGQDLVK